MGKNKNYQLWFLALIVAAMIFGLIYGRSNYAGLNGVWERNNEPKTDFPGELEMSRNAFQASDNTDIFISGKVECDGVIYMPSHGATKPGQILTFDGNTNKLIWK